MDDRELTEALMRKMWRKRDEIHYNDMSASCNHAFVGGKIRTLLAVYARKPASEQPPQLWESGYSEHATNMFMGIGIVPCDTLAAGEWQLRDKTGTVRAFGTLDDIRQEHQP